MTTGEEKNEPATYVPQRIQALATALVHADPPDVDAVLQQLRDMYPLLTTRRTAFSKLKDAVLRHAPRPPDYGEQMEAWKLAIETDVVNAHADAPSLRRLKEWNEFTACALKRQLMIQKKIQIGHGRDFFTDDRDAERVRSLRLVPDYVRGIQLTPEEIRTIQEQQASKLRQLASSVVRIDDAEAIVVWARAILKNAATHESDLAIATATAIVTGRRMYEIFSKGQFTEISGQRYALTFTGQAKTGLQEIVSLQQDQHIAYSIPVLAPASTVVTAVTVLRQRTSSHGMDAKTVNSRFCRRLNQYVKAHVHAHVGFHDLRTMYALMSFEAFKPHTYSINAWVSKNLGHVGLGMSVSYTRMQVYGLHRIQRHHREAAEDFS